MELPAEVCDAILEAWPVARLATSNEDGSPHLVPVVFVRHAGHLWTPVDAKPKATRELARVRNVRRRPEVGLLLDEYDPDWERLWWLRADGRAEVVLGSGTGPAAGELAAVALGLRRKYPQYARVAPFAGEPLALRIEVQRLRSWCAGPAALERAARLGRGARW